ncbi:MAG: hypothetical protein GC155_06020 [Alphaproteobacteria bacterium]|nr:hypothetical protein [Alphaproteobacteria bacterium]
MIEAVWILGLVLLAGGIAYGWWRYATRAKSLDPVTEQATREEYSQPTRDDIAASSGPQKRHGA